VYRIGKILKEIRDQQLWAELEYSSFRAFYSDPELGYKKSSVYRAIRIVEVFPRFEEIKKVPISKLTIILPYLEEKNEKQKKELVSLAASLSTSDLLYEVKDMEAKEVVPKELPLPKIYRCNVCHKNKRSEILSSLPLRNDKEASQIYC
jgi:hypothetical protein